MILDRKPGGVLLGLAILLMTTGIDHAAAGTASFTVDAATVQNFLRAVTPYTFAVGEGGLSENLTLSNPRDIRFEKGRVHLRLDCTGEPFPLNLVLEPVLTVGWNEDEGVFEARIESLPLEVPALGKVDIADFLRPYPIPAVFYQPAGDEQVDFVIQGRITSLRILNDQIHVGGDLSFRRVAPAAPATSTATSGR